MDNVNKNIIQKTIVDLHYNGSRDAFGLQKEIGDWCNLKLSPGIEEVLEKYAANREYIRIEKLELEINVAGKENWLADLSKQVSALLHEKLSGLSLKKEQGFSYSEQTKEQNFFEAFTLFLKTGHLPWWSGIKTRDQFSAAFSSWIKKNLDGNSKTVMYNLSADETIQQRITDQLSRDEFFNLMGQLYAEAANEMIKLKNDIFHLIPLLPVEKRSMTEIKIKRSFWMQSAKRDKIEALKKVAEDFYAAIISSSGSANKINRVQLESGILKQELKKLKGDNKKVSTTKTTTTHDTPGTERKEKDADPEKVKTGESIYINNAGLIIIAPFLPAFFKKLGITEADKIINKNPAACLINYLADGREDIAEFELVLAKILCGIDIKTPVSTSIVFGNDQKNEVHELLLSVIEYWNILKDTSPEGLQQSFLQREGKLTFSNNEWLLQVEQKGYDMLLQHLPWNISMIKLPWMKYLLKTEWIY